MTTKDELIVRGGKVVQAGADLDETDILRDACERSLYVFCKAVLGMSEFTTHLHKPLCNWLQSIPPRKKLLLTPRGTFKTSMARGLGMWATIQPAYLNRLIPGVDGRNLRILYAAENERMGLRRIGWINRQYKHNQLFRTLWPDHVWSPGEQNAETWTLSRFSLPRTADFTEATFEVAGVDSGATGGHFDLIIKDDLIGQRSRKQPELMQSAIDWWRSSHSYCNNPRTYLDFVFGTRWAAADLYDHIFTTETEYDLRIYGATNRPMDLPPSGDHDTHLLFPERLDRVMLEEMRRKYGEVYYLNYENEPYKGGNTAFNMALCGWFERDGLFIDCDEIDLTARTIDLMRVVEGEKAEIKPLKPFYKMTPSERSEAWLEMQRRWHANKIKSIEIN